MSTSEPGDLREFWDEERAENEAAWRKDAIKSLTSSASATAKAQRELAAMRERAETAEAEVERLHSWDGLMELLDEHWPEDVYPTLPDSDERDPGPRIVSALRVQDQLRATLAKVREQADHWLDIAPPGRATSTQIIRQAAQSLLAILDPDGGRDE